MSEEPFDQKSETVQVFGLHSVRCDKHFLYKRALNEERIFELPLVEISNLEVKRSFAVNRYIGALVAAACIFVAFAYIGNEWVTWGIIVILAIVILGLVSDPWDQYISVESKHGAFHLDVEDMVNEKDLDAFVIAVQSRVKQRKKEME